MIRILYCAAYTTIQTGNATLVSRNSSILWYGWDRIIHSVMRKMFDRERFEWFAHYCMQAPIIYGLMESIDKNWSSEEHPRNRPITLLQFPLFYRTMDFGDLNGGENCFFSLPTYWFEQTCNAYIFGGKWKTYTGILHVIFLSSIIFNPNSKDMHPQEPWRFQLTD